MRLPVGFCDMLDPRAPLREALEEQEGVSGEPLVLPGQGRALGGPGEGQGRATGRGRGGPGEGQQQPLLQLVAVRSLQELAAMQLKGDLQAQGAAIAAAVGVKATQQTQQAASVAGGAGLMGGGLGVGAGMMGAGAGLMGGWLGAGAGDGDREGHLQQQQGQQGWERSGQQEQGLQEPERSGQVQQQEQEQGQHPDLDKELQGAAKELLFLLKTQPMLCLKLAKDEHLCLQLQQQEQRQQEVLRPGAAESGGTDNEQAVSPAVAAGSPALSSAVAAGSPAIASVSPAASAVSPGVSPAAAGVSPAVSPAAAADPVHVSAAGWQRFPMHLGGCGDLPAVLDIIRYYILCHGICQPSHPESCAFAEGCRLCSPAVGMEGAVLGMEKGDMGVENPEMGGQGAALGMEKADMGMEKADMGMEKADVGLEEAAAAASGQAGPCCNSPGGSTIGSMASSNRGSTTDGVGDGEVCCTRADGIQANGPGRNGLVVMSGQTSRVEGGEGFYGRGQQRGSSCSSCQTSCVKGGEGWGSSCSNGRVNGCSSSSMADAMRVDLLCSIVSEEECLCSPGGGCAVLDDCKLFYLLQQMQSSCVGHWQRLLGGGIEEGCGVCLEDQPELLLRLKPCLHTFCSACVQLLVGLMAVKPALCPLCRAPIGGLSVYLP